jgi:hypothetical protein
LFRKKMPHGTAFPAPANLGVCANYVRAEDHVFSEMGAEAAYFFEDDMVLSPHYLTMMDRMRDFAARESGIGYFAAYGRHTLDLAQQRARANQVTRLSYHWAFGLTQQHFRELREWLMPYYALSAGRDYKRRPAEEILAHYRALGVPLTITTQDHMKKVGTYMLGRIAINTTPCFGKYIGEEGLHARPHIYERKGYEATELYPEPVDLSYPTPDQIARLHASEMEAKRHRMATALQKRREGKRDEPADAD